MGQSSGSRSVITSHPFTRQTAIASFAFVILVAIRLQGTTAGGEEIELRQFRSFDCGEKTVFTLAVDSGQRLVATGGADAMVSLWDLANAKRLRQWQPSKSSVIDLDFAPDKPHVVSASYPKTLTLYDPAGDQQLWQVQCASAPTRVTFSRDGSKIGVASLIGKASVHDAASGRLIAAMGHPLAASGGVAFSSDAKHLYVGAQPLKGQLGPSEVLRCDAETGAVLTKLGLHDVAITRLRLSPSGQRLVSLDRDGTVKLWNVQGDALVQTWKLEIDTARWVEFMDEVTLAVAGKDRIAIIQFGKPEPVHVLETTAGANNMGVLPARGLVVSAVNTSLHLYAFNKKLITPVKNVIGSDGDAAMAKSEDSFDPLDNSPPGDVHFDGLVSANTLPGLIDQPLVLKLKSGLLVAGANLEELQFDRRGHGLRFLKYKLTSGRSVTVKSSDIYAIRIGSESYHLRYFPPGNQLFLIDTKKANTVAANRLAASNDQPRVEMEEEEQKEATSGHKKFLEEAIKKLANDGTFRIEETESTLILTDLPPAATVGLRRYVDVMNDQLNQLFGIPKGDSIWPGKAILAVFSTKQRFAAFEEKVMDNPNHNGLPGVRGSARRFMQTAIVKEMNPNVARGICWGYSLGFAGRVHSDAQGAPWLKMGLANTMQFVIVPDARRQKSQKDRVIEQLRRDGTLLGILKATKLEQERWPMCGELVRFLIAKDPIAFGQLFRDTKLGVDLEDALQQNYGATLDELALSFGQSLGIAQLTP